MILIAYVHYSMRVSLFRLYIATLKNLWIERGEMVFVGLAVSAAGSTAIV